MRNVPVGSPPGTRVLVRTRAGGCYDNKLGRIVQLCADDFADVALCPPGTPVAWYRVEFDVPADNGGKGTKSDVFRRGSLFPEGYPYDYWGRPSRSAPA